MFIESENEVENFILPDTSMVWAIRYRGNVSVKENGTHSVLPDSVFSGIRKSPRLIKYSNQTANLLIVFEPWGAAAFFEEPLNQLFEQSLQTDYLKGYSDLNNITEQLSMINENYKKVTFIERVLLTKLIRPKTDIIILSAVQKIKLANGNIHIKELTKELCVSIDAFEKRFRRSVGTTPKHFSSIIRLRSAINRHSPQKSLTDTALTAGYYDQSHFIKDFSLFTGQTPHDFFKSVTYW